ncbi:MAG: type II toxin-antitoxin system PemK/MazF family toxin [Salinivirgaceae bacterium]|jgi:mRNA interferase MazF
MVKRFEVWNIDLNPIKGSEINKMRPCLIVSPDEANNCKDICKLIVETFKYQ